LALFAWKSAAETFCTIQLRMDKQTNQIFVLIQLGAFEGSSSSGSFTQLTCYGLTSEQVTAMSFLLAAY